MKRMITTLALAATMVLASASVALADAECAEAGTANHGQHILEYGPSTGGVAFGTPAHFDSGHKPGASFCQGDNNSKPIYLP